jgi:hypothetical protein
VEGSRDADSGRPVPVGDDLAVAMRDDGQGVSNAKLRFP